MSKQLHILEVEEVDEGRPRCPHCGRKQDKLDEHQVGEIYECEFCWERYKVPRSLFVRQNSSAVAEELEALKERIKRLEQELGIKHEP